MKEIISGKLPPWLMRFIKQVGKGMNHYNMISDGDRIILGISGGKDSLALSLALALRRKWLPIHYDLHAVQVEWSEYPLSEEARSGLESFFETLEIPYTVLRAKMFSDSFKKKFSCYLCSRNRKRILFNEAERLGVTKIAFGHHLDDIVETTLINMVYHGTFSTMMPVQNFFNGKLHVIRPMCETHESMVRRVSERLEFPVVSIGCPFKDISARAEMKEIVGQLTKMTKLARENIYNAPWNIQPDYLPTCLHET